MIRTYLPHFLGTESRATARQTHLEVFGDKQPTAILFDYAHKDLLSNAEYYVLPLALLQELADFEKVQN